MENFRYKFRAWDIISKCWRYGSSTITYETGELLPLSDFWEAVENAQFDIESVGDYISFKDKNGKEIYEGDVVQAVSQTGDVFGKGEVKFKLGSFVVGDLQINDVRGLLNEIEVIGNIYENPELLVEA